MRTSLGETDSAHVADGSCDNDSTRVTYSTEIKDSIAPLRVRLYRPTAAFAQSNGPVEFIVDTGASFYILPEEEISGRMRKRIQKMAKGISMATVNGSIVADQCITISLPNLDRTVEFVIVKDSPPLLSVGRLCMLEGFGFFWPPRRTPWLVSPDGRKINLQVHDFVPYCAAAKPKTEPKPTRKIAAGIKALMKMGLEGAEDGLGELRTAVPATAPSLDVADEAEDAPGTAEPEEDAELEELPPEDEPKGTDED